MHDEKRTLEAKLKDYRFDAKNGRVACKIYEAFQHGAGEAISLAIPQSCFEKKISAVLQAFTAEYPVILSTTYAIKGTSV